MKYIEGARQIVAQCWCTEETKHIVMDPVLCETFAVLLNNWMETAAQNQRNADFYRGVLEDCANNLGTLKQAAYTSDDGVLQEDSLVLKIPELVKQLAERVT